MNSAVSKLLFTLVGLGLDKDYDLNNNYITTVFYFCIISNTIFIPEFTRSLVRDIKKLE